MDGYGESKTETEWVRGWRKTPDVLRFGATHWMATAKRGV